MPPPPPLETVEQSHASPTTLAGVALIPEIHLVNVPNFDCESGRNLTKTNKYMYSLQIKSDDFLVLPLLIESNCCYTYNVFNSAIVGRIAFYS